MIEHEASTAFLHKLAVADPAAVEAVCAKLSAECAGRMGEEGVDASRVTTSYCADICYVGQAYHIEVPLDLADPGTMIQKAYEAFIALHDRIARPQHALARQVRQPARGPARGEPGHGGAFDVGNRRPQGRKQRHAQRILFTAPMPTSMPRSTTATASHRARSSADLRSSSRPTRQRSSSPAGSPRSPTTKCCYSHGSNRHEHDADSSSGYCGSNHPRGGAQQARRDRQNEMQQTLLHSAFSPIVKEGMDCSAALFTADGQTVSQATAIPIHLATMIPALAAVIAKYPVEGMAPGDVYILNDPYCGGTHLPDITLFVPVIVDGFPLGFSVATVHHQDVGGMTPGSVPTNATEIYQEGLRIPPLKYIEAGVVNHTLDQILRYNIRMSDMFMGDLNAQLAACTVGARRLGELSKVYGAAQLVDIFTQLLDRSELMTREALRKLPPQGRSTMSIGSTTTASSWTSGCGSKWRSPSTTAPSISISPAPIRRSGRSTRCLPAAAPRPTTRSAR